MAIIQAKRAKLMVLCGSYGMLLFCSSGTMSGGGKSVSKGRMGSSAVSPEFNPTQVKVMETNLEKVRLHLGIESACWMRRTLNERVL